MKKAYTNTIRRNGSGGPLVISTTKKNSQNGRKNGQKNNMPKCMYGSACQRKGCVYQHPSAGDSSEYFEDNKICLPFLADLCPFGRKCRNRHPSKEEADNVRAQYKQRPCSYGDDCQTEGCLYLHSWDVQPVEPKENYNKEMRQQDQIVPNYEQWLEWSCPIPESYGVNHTDIWYRHDGSQKSCEEVYNEIYFPSYNINTCNDEYQYDVSNTNYNGNGFGNQNVEDYHGVPKDCNEWIQMGCPIPQSYYDFIIEQQELLNQSNLSMDPWYTDDGQRKTYEQVYQTIYNIEIPTYQLPTNTDNYLLDPTAQAPVADAQTGWAAIAAKNAKTAITANNNFCTVVPNSYTNTTKKMKKSEKELFVRIPNELWMSNILSSNSDFFHLYPDPMERFYAVNKHHHHTNNSNNYSLQPLPKVPTVVTHLNIKDGGKVTLLDLHYQSSKTAVVVLDSLLPLCYETYDEIWIVTGSGHHSGMNNNHQKKEEMGVLFKLVKTYLSNNEYDFRIGKDGQGNSGVLLVMGSSFYQ